VFGQFSSTTPYADAVCAQFKQRNVEKANCFFIFHSKQPVMVGFYFDDHLIFYRGQFSG